MLDVVNALLEGGHASTLDNPCSLVKHLLAQMDKPVARDGVLNRVAEMQVSYTDACRAISCQAFFGTRACQPKPRKSHFILADGRVSNLCEEM